MAIKSIEELLRGEKRFGRLTFLREGEKRGRNRTVRCVCDCGEVKEIIYFSLTSGDTVSCGCFHKQQQVEIAREVGQNNKKHGEWRKTPEYAAWCSMRKRCNSKTHPAYGRYGGRGISVCDRWSEYVNFISDMGRKPSKDHSIDRINNDGDYEPKNCRWATHSEQNLNRRPLTFK